MKRTLCYIFYFYLLIFWLNKEQSIFSNFPYYLSWIVWWKILFNILSFIWYLLKAGLLKINTGYIKHKKCLMSLLWFQAYLLLVISPFFFLASVYFYYRFRVFFNDEEINKCHFHKILKWYPPPPPPAPSCLYDNSPQLFWHTAF